MAVEVYMPKMSDHMESGEIAEWLISEGDRVEEGQCIIEIVTDKTTAEIEAPVSGIVRGIRKGTEKGAVVPVGEAMAFIVDEGEEVPELPPLEESGEKLKQGAVEKEGQAGRYRDPAGDRHSIGGETSAGIKAAPAARRRARELQVDLQDVKGTGPGGIITVGDVDKYIQSAYGQDRP